MASGTRHPRFWGVLATVVVFDFVTKQIAASALAHRSPVFILGDWLRLVLVYNTGAAFGIDVGVYSRWVFTALAIVALLVLGGMAHQTPPARWFRLTALGMVCGGAVGNLIDRLRSASGVIDFIDVWIGRFHWPTFNVADMAVSCGAIALAVVLWQEGRDGSGQAAERADPAEA